MTVRQITALCLLVASFSLISVSEGARTQLPDRIDLICSSLESVQNPEGSQQLGRTPHIRVAQTCTADCLTKYRDCLNRGESGCWDKLQECLKECK